MYIAHYASTELGQLDGSWNSIFTRMSVSSLRNQ